MTQTENRIRQLRKERRMSQSDLADAIGVSIAAISNWERGEDDIKTENVQKLANFFNVAPAYIRGEMSDLQQGAASAGVLRQIDVVGRLAAGSWLERDDFSTPENFPRISIVITRYQGLPQFAYQVQGTSMDKKGIVDGDYVICVPFAESRGHARNAAGDIVVVERRNGSLVERTCKEVVLGANRIELWPRSTDPDWQTPIIVPENENPDDGIEIVIVGLVIGKYTPF